MNNRKQWVLGVVLSALMVLAIGCGKKKPPPPPPPPPAPVSATLNASPANIQRGQSSTLTWSTQNATDVSLDGNKVDPNGSQNVSPTQTTTYHLSAKGAGGTQDATATVTVVQPPPPTPTPTPAPTPVPPGDDEIFNQNVKDVYFDFDKSDLRPESAQILARSAEVIKQHPNWVVQVQGNCDERGSIEYNLTLGERRANSAQQALIQNGVSSNQLKTISFGKEKPACTESNEDCWQKNRRDHFVLMH